MCLSQQYYLRYIKKMYKAKQSTYPISTHSNFDILKTYLLMLNVAHIITCQLQTHPPGHLTVMINVVDTYCKSKYWHITHACTHTHNLEQSKTCHILFIKSN